MPKPIRNPERVIAALRAVLTMPGADFRVGQAIVNALPPEFIHDAFYIEDNTLAERLEKFAAERFYYDEKLSRVLEKK